MKRYVFISVLLSILVVSYSNARIRVNKMNEFIRVSTKNPRYFETTSGHAWIPIMINFVVPNGNDAKVFQEIEMYFKHFSENGGNAMRIWISTPFLEIEDKKVGEYDKTKFNRIDHLVSLAEKYNIRVLFVLQHIRTISNESAEGWANSQLMSIENGGPFKNIEEYVSSSSGEKAYLNRARALSQRYKNNSAIFGWELWNEMDAFGVDWYSFTGKMLDSIKTLFPHQLIVQSLGSMQSLGSLYKQKDVNNYMQLLTLKNNDYINIHRYLDPESKVEQESIVCGPTDLLVADAIHTVYKPDVLKPVIFEEIGATAPNWSGPCKLYFKDTIGVLAHDMIFAPFFCGAAGCGSMWYWNVYVEKNNLWYQYQRFKNVITGINPIEEEFVPFQFNNDSVRCYGLKGKTTTMIWCRDAENNWKTELQQNIKPTIKKDFSFSLNVTGKTGYTSAKVYDPWKDKWSKVKIKNGSITLRPFLRSAIVILN
jgi:hypothetical protein